MRTYPKFHRLNAARVRAALQSLVAIAFTCVGAAIANAEYLPSFNTPLVEIHSEEHNNIQGLVQLAHRARIKPYNLLRSATDEYPSERVVFRDTTTGTVLWKMARNPGYNRHIYSNVLVWNADGSQLLLRSDRPGASWWLVAADGSRWTPFRTDCFGWVFWSPVERNKVFHTVIAGEERSRDLVEVHKTDVLSGKSHLLWKLPLERENIKLVRPSHDGRKLLIRENGVPIKGTTHAFAWLLNADGTGQPQRFDLGTEAGQTWFLKRPDYSFMFAEASETRADYGDRQWVCEPARNGALRILDSQQHFNHAGVSPSGKRVAFQRAGAEKGVTELKVTDVETGQSRACVSGPRSNGEHLSWECDDRWLVASMGNEIKEVWVDENRARVVCLANTHHSMRAECEPESSPDGTKFGYASTMLGDCDFYVAVQRLPDPPRNIHCEGRILTWSPPQRCRELAGYGVYSGTKLLNHELLHECRYELPEADSEYTVVAVEHSGLQSPCPDKEPPPVLTGVAAVARSPFAVALSWPASPATDVSYYNVYCSSQPQPAAVQENRVASPTEPQLLDWGLQAGRQYYYSVTAVDRAGNENAPSSPVNIQTPAISRVFQRISVEKTLGREPLAVTLTVPADDRYLLWFEIKADHVADRQSFSIQLDGGRTILWAPFWDFVCLAHGNPEPIPFFDTLKIDRETDPWFPLKAGAHCLSVSLPKGSATLISLLLTNDAGFVPKGISSFRNSPEKDSKKIENNPR